MEKGQNLNQHGDYHNHPDYPNHTLNFGKFMGSNLQMLRARVCHSYDREHVRLWFHALKVTHRVTEVTTRIRYSATLYTPSRLEHLTIEDWDSLGRLGFPIYLCNSESFRKRSLIIEALPQVSQSQPLESDCTQMRHISSKRNSPHILALAASQTSSTSSLLRSWRSTQMVNSHQPVSSRKTMFLVEGPV